MSKRIISLLVCLVMLMGMALPVCAEETESPEEPVVTTLRIATREDFLTFAENCRLDTYSLNMEVSLDADIDLTGCSFRGIPIFSGTFDGQGHLISGLNISGDGSMQGLFRYLTATATVRNLSVSGTVQPGGSQNQVGAIAGRNEGRILNCSFSGTVSGGDYVGGIAGTNEVTGMIESCHTEGILHGNHFVGGIAGENCGVVRSCSNSASINTTPQQNSVDIEDITMDTLTNTEAVNTVTDIGGIAGISSGVIRACRNQGDVGYQHMGYNIGGIAGTQSGYVVDCENQGRIQGRKEVGGIVGQMEPATLIEYTEDTLQILQGQLNTMSGLVNQASGNAQANAGGISSQIGVLQDQAQTARDAVETLFPDADNPQIPDPDTLLAAQNTLSSTLNAMPGTLSNIAAATQTTVYSLTRDLNAISGQISAMGETLNSASENLGGSITDISDADTPELLTGKVENCTNWGNVLADINAGGIAGAMAMENDLDILEDWAQSGDESMNFQSEVRAVILSCENRGLITGKKQNAGGIAGWQSLGLIRNSTNAGTIDAAGADYAGGIAGLSTGFIRESFAKCEIRGKTNLGGIAGSGTIVTDSLSQVKLLEGKEKLGAILGFAQEPQTETEEPIARNYYLCVGADMGAVDGISYAGQAEPVALETFMAIEDLPELFRSVRIRFVADDGSAVERTVAPGGDLDPGKIPAVPEKEGLTGAWAGLEATALTGILFDMTFEAAYNPYITSIQSQLLRENGRPVLLAEGSFTADAAVSVAESAQRPLLGEGEQLLEVWDISLTEPGTTGRFLLPENVDAADIKLLALNGQGNWEEIPFTQDGSCLVFSLSQNMTIALVEAAETNVLICLAAGALVLAAVAVVWVFTKKKAPHRKEEAHEEA